MYFFTSREFMLSLVGTGTVLMIILDVLKAYTYTFESLYRKVFGSILRSDEKDFKRNLFTGGTYYAIGIFLAVLLFQKEIAVLSILIMIWCDTMAALFGKKFGKRKIVGDKSLEGSLAFIIAGALLILVLQYFIPDFNYYKAGFITVLLTAVFEQLSFVRINDNLSIPVFSGYVFIILNNYI
jgi:dolichol kinase